MDLSSEGGRCLIGAEAGPVRSWFAFANVGISGRQDPSGWRQGVASKPLRVP